jgi:hypothetical protein
MSMEITPELSWCQNPAITTVRLRCPTRAQHSTRWSDSSTTVLLRHGRVLHKAGSLNHFNSQNLAYIPTHKFQHFSITHLTTCERTTPLRVMTLLLPTWTRLLSRTNLTTTLESSGFLPQSTYCHVLAPSLAFSHNSAGINVQHKGCYLLYYHQQSAL